jgi:1-aminocyclopropane-1-carboxylate deaminase/D-cysteine desulfhydrase-like pyridoxal-dependent ACC family enzyme
MAGLMDLAGRGILDRAIPTVFIHTGGSPILFAFNQEFQKLAKFTRL